MLAGVMAPHAFLCHTPTLTLIDRTSRKLWPVMVAISASVTGGLSTIRQPVASTRAYRVRKLKQSRAEGDVAPARTIGKLPEIFACLIPLHDRKQNAFRQAGKTDVIYWDDAVPGFGLRIRQAGARGQRPRTSR